MWKYLFFKDLILKIFLVFLFIFQFKNVKYKLCKFEFYKISETPNAEWSNVLVKMNCLHLYTNTAHKMKFPLSISSVNVTKSAVSSGFGHIYWRSSEWKSSFFVQWKVLEWDLNEKFLYIKYARIWVSFDPYFLS